MLHITDLGVTYPDGTQALRGLNLQVGPGERVALIGANGAGKTSLILSLVGLLPATGHIQLQDVPLNAKTLATLRQRMGVVFQNPDEQLFMPTIYDDVAFGLRHAGQPENEVRQRVTSVLEQLGISALAEKSAARLSGGQKRMAALATVLVMNPSVLLLDEPTAFLDPRARRQIINVLRGLPVTQVIATHDLPFALQVCPRTALLHEGQVYADGPTRELLHDAERMNAAGIETIEQLLETE